MIKFDQLRIPVTDLARSRSWYINTLGLKLEFEVPDRQTVALQDSNDFTIFLQQTQSGVLPNGCALWFRVVPVDPTFADLPSPCFHFAPRPPKSYSPSGA